MWWAQNSFWMNRIKGLCLVAVSLLSDHPWLGMILVPNIRLTTYHPLPELICPVIWSGEFTSFGTQCPCFLDCLNWFHGHCFAVFENFINATAAVMLLSKLACGIQFSCQTIGLWGSSKFSTPGLLPGEDWSGMQNIFLVQFFIQLH